MYLRDSVEGEYQNKPVDCTDQLYYMKIVELEFRIKNG